MKSRVVDRIPIDLANVQVLFHLGDVGRLDPVGDAPDFAIFGRWVRVGQGGPEGVLD